MLSCPPYQKHLHLNQQSVEHFPRLMFPALIAFTFGSTFKGEFVAFAVFSSLLIGMI